MFRNVSANNAYSSRSSNSSNSSTFSNAADDQKAQELVSRSVRRRRRGANTDRHVNSSTGLGYNRCANRRKNVGTNRSNDSREDRPNYRNRNNNKSLDDRNNMNAEDQSSDVATRLHEEDAHESDERSRRSSANRSLSTGVLASRKRKSAANEAREGKAESASSTSDYRYSLDGKRSSFKQHVSTATSTDDLDSPRWKSRRAFGQKPVERLDAKTLPVVPFSLGKWRYRVYLLYIWGLCMLSLLLFYTFLWRISIKELW